MALMIDEAKLRVLLKKYVPRGICIRNCAGPNVPCCRECDPVEKIIEECKKRS